MGGAKDGGKTVSYTLKVDIKGGSGATTSSSGNSVAAKACLAAVAKEVGLSVSQFPAIEVLGSQVGIGVHVERFLTQKDRTTARCQDPARLGGWPWGSAHHLAWLAFSSR